MPYVCSGDEQGKLNVLVTEQTEEAGVAVVHLSTFSNEIWVVLPVPKPLPAKYLK